MRAYSHSRGALSAGSAALLMGTTIVDGQERYSVPEHKRRANPFRRKGMKKAPIRRRMSRRDSGRRREVQIVTNYLQKLVEAGRHAPFPREDRKRQRTVSLAGVPTFEIDHIPAEYRDYYATKRQNLFARIQGFPALWKLYGCIPMKSGIAGAFRICCRAAREPRINAPAVVLHELPRKDSGSGNSTL